MAEILFSQLPSGLIPLDWSLAVSVFFVQGDWYTEAVIRTIEVGWWMLKKWIYQVFSHHHLLFLILQQEDSFAQCRKIKGNRPRPTTARPIGCGVLSSTKLNLLPTLVADVRSRPQGQRTLANATLDWIQEVTRPFNQEVGVSNAMRATLFRGLAIEAIQTYSLSHYHRL